MFWKELLNCFSVKPGFYFNLLSIAFKMNFKNNFRKRCLFLPFVTFFLQRQVYTFNTIIQCSTIGSVAVFAILSTTAPQSLFVRVMIYQKQHLFEDSICNVPSIKTAVMNFVPLAKKCSSWTLSPTPVALLQIGSPQHSTLCYSLCQIVQAKSWIGEGNKSAQSKVSENGLKHTHVF